MDQKYIPISESDIDDDGDNSNASDVKWRRRGGAIILMLCFFGGSSWLVKSTPKLSQLSADSEEGHEVSEEKLGFAIASFDYSDSPEDAYPFLESNRFVEPFRPSSMTIQGSSFTTCDWSISFVSGGGPWDDISSAPTTTGFSSKGKISKKAHESTFEATTVNFPGPGIFSVTLTCERENGQVETLTEDVTCRYVRRELRDLTFVDREAFLDAFMVMYRTSTEEGIDSYGEHFKPLSNFLSVHLDKGATRDTDHLHDGLGLATQHIALTMEFELALQSIKPRVTVPYWDYTVDSAKIQSRNPENYFTDASSIFHESELFTADFFGYSDKATPYVSEGRFSHVVVARDYGASTKSSRGFLRAPWNLNPSHRVTRFHSLLGADEVTSVNKDFEWPTCASHLGMATSDNFDTWFEWSWNMGYKPHGPVHSWIGGTGGGDGEAKVTTLYEDGLLTEDQFLNFRTWSFALLKNMWRKKVIEVPKSCSEDAPVSECTWICVEDAATNDETKYWFEIFVGLSSSDSSFDKVVRSFCEMTYWPGDHLEAASPIEASFWTIHPTVDRLLQYKDLVQPFKDMAWVSERTDIPYGGELCIYTDCLGHHANDLTYAKSVVKNSDGSFSLEYITNEEVRDASLPTRGYSLPYIYNHFEWKHCDELGHVFPKVSK